MKAFLVAIIIFAVMITGGICSELYIDDVSKNIESFTITISELANKDSYEEIRNSYKNMNQYWQAKKMFLSTLIDHVHVSEIDKALNELEAALREEDSIEISLAVTRARSIIKTVSQNEGFNFTNIL